MIIKYFDYLLAQVFTDGRKKLYSIRVESVSLRWSYENMMGKPALNEVDLIKAPKQVLFWTSKCFPLKTTNCEAKSDGRFRSSSHWVQLKDCKDLRVAQTGSWYMQRSFTERSFQLHSSVVWWICCIACSELLQDASCSGICRLKRLPVSTAVKIWILESLGDMKVFFRSSLRKEYPGVKFFCFLLCYSMLIVMKIS